MAVLTVAKNYMLTQLGGQVDFISLHTAYPPTDGNEISGGSPAYARKAVTWGTSSSGSISATNAPVFDVPAGTTVGAVGFYPLATGAVIQADFDVTDEVFAGQGTYTVTSASINLNA